MGRTDEYVLVLKAETGERFSFVGSKKECEEAARSKQEEKAWKKAEAQIEKR